MKYYKKVKLLNDIYNELRDEQDSLLEELSINKADMTSCVKRMNDLKDKADISTKSKTNQIAGE